MEAGIQYRNLTASFGGPSPLSEGVGFSILICFGLFFTVFSLISTNLHLYHNNIKLSSEYFTTAGRHVGIGMTACAIVSSWTWSATILQSSNVTYLYGVSGALWYGAGACIQLFLFGIMSFHLKKYATNCHTVGEIIYARWGPTTHKVFLYIFFLTNFLVVSMLIGGGSSVFEALTGMDRGSASFFLRLFFYVGSGGLIATYSSAYLHVVLIFLMMVVFVFEVYCFSSLLGSAEEVYRRVKAIPHLSLKECSDFGYDPQTQTCGGVEGNFHGSYLTVQSSGGLVFGIINIVGNFGAVFLDQSYWQIAIASHPDACFKGFILGGLLWFSIPFCMSMSLGLANIALQLPTSISEAAEGLVPVASSIALLGRSGAIGLLIQLLMAVSAAGTAELNAISSLLTYDIYRIYINPTATSEEIKYYSRLTILSSGSLMGALSVLVQTLGLPLGWLYLFMGVMIGSGVFPICCCLIWKKATANAAIWSVLIGQGLALSSWLFSAYYLEGEITIESTGRSDVMLVGNLVALLSSLILMTSITLYDPDDFDLHSLNSKITLVGEEKEKEKGKDPLEIHPLLINNDSTTRTINDNNDDNDHDEIDLEGSLHTPPSTSSSASTSTSTSASTTNPLNTCRTNHQDHSHIECSIPHPPPPTTTSTTSTTTTTSTIIVLPSSSLSQSSLFLHSYLTHYSEYIISIFLSFLFVILWPVLSLPESEFSLHYFIFWISIVVVWSVLACIIVIVLPLYEGRVELEAIIIGLMNSLPPLSPLILHPFNLLSSRISQHFATSKSRNYPKNEEKAKEEKGNEETTDFIELSRTMKINNGMGAT